MNPVKPILFCTVCLWMFSCAGKPSVDGEKVREYANALYNRELFEPAIREYQRYLDLYHADNETQANVNFIMANTYFERLHDYENALAGYLKIKHLFPESAIAEQTDRQIVACLERLQRTADAKQALDEATLLNPDEIEKPRPGEIVAKIGSREITSGDLRFQINQLPDYIQTQLKDKQARLEYLRQMIATDLFYDAAKRQALDSDKEVVEATYQAKKSLMVQKYLENEISGEIKINPEDVKLYYDANKDRYAEKDEAGKVKRQKPFQEVRDQAAQDLLQERQQRAYEKLLDRMVEAEDVRIFEDKIK